MSLDLAPTVDIDWSAVYQTLKLNPADAHTQALLVICNKYGLDPLLKHIVLIQGRPYVTRDGYLSIAHRHGAFDGIEILEEGVTETYWWARASVYRKDMGHPFTYRGRYPKKGGNSAYGPEMAIKCAEVMALRRAFNVTGVGAAEERWDTDLEEGVTPQVVADLAERVNALGQEARTRFYNRFHARPQELPATAEQDAIEFVTMMEDEAEYADEVSPVGDESVPADVGGVELDEPAGDQPPEGLGL